MLDALARQAVIERLSLAPCPLVLGNRDLVALSSRRLGAQRLGLVEELRLRGIGLLGAGAKLLVPGEPQLLLEALDLERLLAHQRLQCRRIVRQIGSAWRCRLGHARSNS